MANLKARLEKLEQQNADPYAEQSLLYELLGRWEVADSVPGETPEESAKVHKIATNFKRRWHANDEELLTVAHQHALDTGDTDTQNAEAWRAERLAVHAKKPGTGFDLVLELFERRGTKNLAIEALERETTK